MTAKSFLTLFQLFICLAKKTLELWNAAIATASIACQIANNRHLLWISFLCILIIYLAHFLCCVFKVTYLFLWRLPLVLGRRKRERKCFRWSRFLGAWDSPRLWKLVRTLWCIWRNLKLNYQFYFLLSLAYTQVPFFNFISKCFIWDITYLHCLWEIENTLAEAPPK